MKNKEEEEILSSSSESNYSVHDSTDFRSSDENSETEKLILDTKKEIHEGNVIWVLLITQDNEVKNE